MNKARVVITKQCDRSCSGCCNKEWDLDNLPIIGDEVYDMLLLTGGEPLKFVEELILLMWWFRAKSQGEIIVYTAKLDSPSDINKVLNCADGITVTLHEPEDVADFIVVDKHISRLTGRRRCRLNVFKGVEIPALRGRWSVKDNIEWINPGPLPAGEKLMRVPFFLGG